MPSEIARIAEFTKYWKMQFELIELTSALTRLNGAIRIGLATGNMKVDDVVTEMRVLRESVDAELCYRRFVHVPGDKAKVWDELGNSWADVWQKFPDAKIDSEEAVWCYVVGRSTASVFHSMRAAEYGLRALAKKLRVKLLHKGKTHPIEFADWEKVITGINNKISSARLLPHGTRRARMLQLCSDGADHCSYMKDIWRNDISHARKSYNSPEALAVMQRVHDFLGFLAKGT